MTRARIAIGMLVLLHLAALRASAGVVFNEVMYHPPGERDDLQFIELLNSGTAPVDLKGWRFTKGVQCELLATNFPAGGLGVVCRDLAAFQQHYGSNVPIVGVFVGHLKHSGERIQIERPDGAVVDALKFVDREPWPVGPDGYGASLERRTPSGASDDPNNWGGSVLPKTRLAGGTPGRTNSNFAAKPLPRISEVRFGPVIPAQPIQISARVSSSGGISKVVARWWLLKNADTEHEASAAMAQTPADVTQGLWRVTLPPPPAGDLFRFRIEATDSDGNVRWLPDANDPQPTFSAYVIVNTNTAQIAEGRLLFLGARGGPAASRFRPNAGNRVEPARGNSAFVVLPTNGGPALTFDYIRLTARHDGWKVRLHKDQPYVGITTLNVIRDGNPRWRLSEPLSYELFRRAGVPAPMTGHLRVWSDGRPLGYCLYVEQPNASFLHRVGRDSDGSLYKLLWYGNDLVTQHEKKTRLAEGHDDLRAAVNGLKSRRTTDQTAFIDQQFDVDECVNYFAVSQCIQNWDGFFNNYFAYRAPGPTGRWEMLPWDLDKTWGEYDGCSADYDWYSLPLTFGMNGDKQPSSSWFSQRRNPWGSVDWWRPPGWFSGPLLANASVRDRFLKRLGELCRTEFTEQRFGPVISDLETRLGPEVAFRAAAEGRDVSESQNEFRKYLESFRRQLKERRAFLVSELGKVGVKVP